jgi:hypothetical protein
VKFAQVFTDEWIPWRKREYFECCDCSLVHKMEVRIKNGQLEARFYRDNRMTAQRRRALKIEVKHKDKEVTFGRLNDNRRNSKVTK